MDKKKTENIFRFLLVASLCLLFVAAVVLVLDEVLTGQKVIDAVGEEDTTPGSIALTGFTILVGVIVFPAYIASVIGLFFWKPWARWLYAGQYVFGLFATTIFSACVFYWDYRWDLPESIMQLSTAVDVAILVMLFVSPITENFASKSTNLVPTS
jgi:hypothetical protein